MGITAKPCGKQKRIMSRLEVQIEREKEILKKEKMMKEDTSADKD